MELDPQALIGDWRYPTSVRFGPGRLRELPGICENLGCQRPLVVSDPGVLSIAAVDEAVETLRSSLPETAVFSAVTPNPDAAEIEIGAEAYRKAGCDGLVAIGGGSVIDAAKAIALVVGPVANGAAEVLWSFDAALETRPSLSEADLPPLIAAPTTAGTGSEAARAAVILDREGPGGARKRILYHRLLMPRQVVADPVPTLSLPHSLTATTAMDALSHCLEALCAKGDNSIADGIAVSGIRLIRSWLPSALRNGHDLSARICLMAAASMGAAAFQKGLGAAHALSHPLGARYGLHHGLLNGILLPYVLQFNRAAVAERLLALSKSLGIPLANDRRDCAGLDAILDWLLVLREDIGIPHSLTAAGLEVESEQEVEAILTDALADPTARFNPMPLAPDNLRPLLEAAMVGRLER